MENASFLLPGEEKKGRKASRIQQIFQLEWIRDIKTTEFQKGKPWNVYPEKKLIQIYLNERGRRGPTESCSTAA